MLGRLLQNAASTFTHHPSSRPQTPLESVTEEAHTRELLYPDTHTLRASQQSGFPLHGGRLLANAREAADYDDRGGLEVAYPADVRIIIAQDANSRYQQPHVLYDSNPPQSSSSPGNASPSHELDVPISQRKPSTNSKATPSPARTSSRRYHTPNSSIFQSSQIQSSMPASPRSPDYRLRSLGGDLRPRSSPFHSFEVESESTQARLTREAKEETDALLACMFGAPGFRIEPGTKLHVLPGKSPDEPREGGENARVARPYSSGGSVRKRTPLTRSTSAADTSDDSSGHKNVNNGGRQVSKSAVMFTRLFSVQLPDSISTDNEDKPNQPAHRPSTDEPDISQLGTTESSTPRSAKAVKQKKVPMYAIAVILQLPIDGQHARLRSQASHHALSSLGSSFNEVTPAASWTTEHSMFSRYMELRGSGSSIGAGSISNSFLSHLLSQWAIIGRSMEDFESTVRNTLRQMLERTIPLVPLISAPPTRLGNTKIKRPAQPTQQVVYVLPSCLQSDCFTQRQGELTGQRIINGLKTRRVITGQGRWGAWREEARWVGRWAGGRDQNFFFFTLLTAFLGHNTSWLEWFAPSLLRRRHASQHHTLNRSVDRLHQRTVIVSSDKMAARRLVFLLAAFIPNLHAQAYLPLPALPYPAMTYSESPPSMPAARDPPLRQTINSRSGGIARHGTSRDGHARSVSFSLMGAGGATESHNDLPFENPTINRRMSDSRSLKSSSSAIPGGPGDKRKAATSTVIAESAAPVPHFASISVQPTVAQADRFRPGSSGSLASLALTHTLKRSDSTALSTSGSAGRWGSVVSGFWSNRRASSTDESEALGTSHDGVSDMRPISGSKKVLTSSGKLAQMVQEASNIPVPEVSGSTCSPSKTLSKGSGEPINLDDALISDTRALQPDASAARTIPRKAKPEKMPLKLSMNEEDGYIDIEMPQTRSFTSSMDSSFNSLHLPNASFGSFPEHYLPYGMPSTPDSPRPKPSPVIDVAGWLKRYQPDFTLQAVRPYDALKNDIQNSMRAESCLLLSSDLDGLSTPNSNWIDICTTLIADTTNFSIQRLTLCRRRKAISQTQPPTSLSLDDFEERFLEEPIMDMDATLIDAVERVLAQSSYPSRVHSRAASPSRAGSIRVSGSSRPVSMSDGVARGHAGGNNAAETPKLELPHTECRRMVLGALEEVVRSVLAEEQDQYQGSVDSTGRSKEMEMPDSTLREGVRKWLVEVDER